MKVVSSLSLVLSSLLLVGACGDDSGDGDGNNNTPDAAGETGPDAQEGLPACAGAQTDYDTAGEVEATVYPLYGMSTAIDTAQSEQIVVFQEGEATITADNYELTDSEDALGFEFCIDWDGICNGGYLVPSEGAFELTTYEDPEVEGSKIEGEFVGAVFVDDAETPTCQARVNLSFSGTFVPFEDLE